MRVVHRWDFPERADVFRTESAFRSVLGGAYPPARSRPMATRPDSPQTERRERFVGANPWRYRPRQDEAGPRTDAV